MDRRTDEARTKYCVVCSGLKPRDFHSAESATHARLIGENVVCSAHARAQSAENKKECARISKVRRRMRTHVFNKT